MSRRQLKVGLILSRYPTPNYPIFAQIVRAWVDSGASVTWDLTANMSLISNKIKDSEKFDLVLILGGENLSPQRILPISELIRSKKIPFVLWTSEDPDLSNATLEIATSFDFIFSNCKNSAELYRQHGHNSAFLPLAAGESLYFRRALPLNLKSWDVAFVGSCWPNRLKFFSGFCSMLNEPSFEYIRPYIRIFRNHELREMINQSSDYFNLLPLFLDNYTSPRSLSYIYNSSVVSLNLLRDFGNGTLPPPLNNRFYEIGLAGGYQILIASKNTDLGEIPPAVRVITADDEKVIIGKILDSIGSILSDPDSYKRDIDDTQDYILKNHTFINRLRTIETTILHDQIS